MQPLSMGKGETRQINVAFDWTRENVTKDWSLTAWGTTSPVQVRHSDSSKTTAHMPHHEDDNSGGPPQPLPDGCEGDECDGDNGPDPIVSTCNTHTSTDNGATDPYGDGCDAYA